MTADLDDPLPGRTLAGRFRVDRALKRGGMGAVYRGHDTRAGVDVAIKVVKQTLADDPEAIARFKREIRLMAEVQDPHIVRAIDAGDEGGVLWIAMELLDGPSLRERLDSRGRWPWADTLPVIRQIALALGAAHDKGVIHRDLKPENIMLVEGGGASQVKLLDFGVAKQSRSADAAATHMTGTGLLVGTPGYVAPEVVLEGTVDDPRSDFYALGVTWFEMLTGQKPFSAKTPMALALRHAHETPPTPSSLLPFAPVPGPVERLVMRLLEKSPEARPASAADLVTAVDALKSAAEQANTPVSTIMDLSPSESTVTSMETPGTHVARLAAASSSLLSSSSPSTVVTPAPGLTVAAPSSAPRRLTPRQGIAAGLALVVVVAGGALWAATGGRERRPKPPSAAPIGVSVFGGHTEAAPAPLVAMATRAVPSDSDGGAGGVAPGGDPAPEAKTPPSDDPGVADPWTAPEADGPPTKAKLDPVARKTAREARRQARQQALEHQTATTKPCTIKDGTSSGWQVHDGQGWRELSVVIPLVPGPQTLRFRRPGAVDDVSVAFDVPESTRCIFVWKGP